jgi:hypothetical protein
MTAAATPLTVKALPQIIAQLKEQGYSLSLFPNYWK